MGIYSSKLQSFYAVYDLQHDVWYLIQSAVQHKKAHSAISFLYHCCLVSVDTSATLIEHMNQKRCWFPFIFGCRSIFTGFAFNKSYNTVAAFTILMLILLPIVHLFQPSNIRFPTGCFRPTISVRATPAVDNEADRSVSHACRASAGYQLTKKSCK